MNRKHFSKLDGRDLRIRPIPIWRGSAGERLPGIDDAWHVEILENPFRARLTNTRTGHCVELQADNIREYRSPDFLLLRCQVTINPDQLVVEPILTQNPIVPVARYQFQKQKIVEQFVPVDPLVCEGCTTAIQFRPVIRISLSPRDGEGSVSQLFCPKCARARGINALIAPDIDESTVYADRNPTYREYALRILRRPVLPALSEDPELRKFGVTSSHPETQKGR